MIILLEAGRRLRTRRTNTTSSSAIEIAVFGLFGLLLAFIFSGAVTRYDTHRLLLKQEINNIGTACLRLSLLPPQLVYMLLFVFSCVSAFIAGYSTKIDARD